MSRILETDENGALTIPPELLDHAEAHARYVVEKNGDALTVLPHAKRPDDSGGHEERMRRWRDLADRVAKESVTDRSVVDILSEMRR